MLSHIMILAAGLGLRMRPLTQHMPKPLVPVNGKPLIDWALDFACDAGIEVAVINTSYLAEMIENHVAHRTHPHVLISREEQPLETGGGIAHALPLLRDEPFFSINSDAITLPGAEHPLKRLFAAWDASGMDALLLIVPTEEAIGYEGAGDFFLEDGVLTRRGDAESAPYVFTGVQILHPRLFENAPDGVFSLNLLYDRDLSRINAIVHDGRWLHVGDIKGLARAEGMLGN